MNKRAITTKSFYVHFVFMSPTPYVTIKVLALMLYGKMVHSNMWTSYQAKFLMTNEVYNHGWLINNLFVITRVRLYTSNPFPSYLNESYSVTLGYWNVDVPIIHFNFLGMNYYQTSKMIWGKQIISYYNDWCNVPLSASPHPSL